MRSLRRARRCKPRRPKVGRAGDRRPPGASPTDRETDERSIGLPRSGDCERRLAPQPTASDASPKLRWQHPIGTDPSVHLECVWKPGTDRVPPARHVGLDTGWPSHGSAGPLGGSSR
jgi:hypothetical protein